ncbi:hypothetical protein D3C81_1796480 [compost metagenome]
MKRKWIFLGIMVLITITLSAACSKKVLFVGSSWGSKNKIEASYKLFTGTEERKVSLKNGETLAIDYQSEVEKGELTIKLYDPDDQLLKSLGTNQSGNEGIGINKDGKYRLESSGNTTKGSYEIMYNIE